jgi:hypothetical protein
VRQLVIDDPVINSAFLEPGKHFKSTDDGITYEIVARSGKQYLTNKLREANEAANPELDRMAFKMATGSGKTVVMAMLTALHALNKSDAPQDARFGRWAFREIGDPWDAKNAICAALAAQGVGA